LPLFAPLGPPLTGASRNCTPSLASSPCSRRTRLGELVERSNHAVPGRSTGFSFAATASTSSGPGTELNSSSQSCTASGAAANQLKPSTRRRSCARTS